MNKLQPKIALGPILYYWTRDDVFDFYENIANTSVDIVYIGEAICSKRKLLRTDDWLQIAEKLTSAGKEVILSTLTLLEAESELKTLRKLCANKKFMIEANDMAAVQLMEGRDFVTGPSVNIYNAHTLKKLASAGLHRWTLPVELSRATLADIQQERPEGVETEVFVYGRLPLAYSARCFTARYYNLAKDDCQYRCSDYADGLTLSSQDNKSFLTLNGIQIQSACFYNLLPVLGEIKQLGVEVIRISPQSRHTDKIIELFRQGLSNQKNIEAANVQLKKLIPVDSCDGYWYGHPGMADEIKISMANIA
ncbi:MAG: U32 family peptidase [Thiomargarita sp.]|nr:U32 family peptidase [Thiomargarita sp.]